MGYSTRLDGSISFDPPATHLEVQEIIGALKGDFYGSIELHVETHVTETAEGTLRTKTASEIVPTTNEGHKAYTVDKELEAIVALLPGREFSGQILWDGEESSDIGRYRVVDGNVVAEKARWSFDD